MLGVLAAVFAVGCFLCTNATVDLSSRAQQLYGAGQENPPTTRQMDEANRLSQQGYGLQLLVMPLAAGSLMSALAIPAVLARRWQLREAAVVSEPERADA